MYDALRRMYAAADRAADAVPADLRSVPSPPAPKRCAGATCVPATEDDAEVLSERSYDAQQADDPADADGTPVRLLRETEDSDARERTLLRRGSTEVTTARMLPAESGGVPGAGDRVLVVTSGWLTASCASAADSRPGGIPRHHQIEPGDAFHVPDGTDCLVEAGPRGARFYVISVRSERT